MKKLRVSAAGPLALFFAVSLVALLINSCGDTGPNGQVKNNWIINAVLFHDNETNTVTAYAQVTKDGVAYQSALVKLDDTVGVRSNGDGSYQANFARVYVGDTALVSVESIFDNFQFQAVVVLPDTFSFQINGLTNNQVFSSSFPLTLSWTGSDQAEGYLGIVKPNSPTSTAIGFRGLFPLGQSSIPVTAFSNSQQEFQTGSYSIWVASYVGDPINTDLLPFTLPPVFAPNVDRVGVTGQIGALSITKKIVVTAVTGL